MGEQLASVTLRNFIERATKRIFVPAYESECWPQVRAMIDELGLSAFPKAAGFVEAANAELKKGSKVTTGAGSRAAMTVKEYTRQMDMDARKSAEVLAVTSGIVSDALLISLEQPAIYEAIVTGGWNGKR